MARKRRVYTEVVDKEGNSLVKLGDAVAWAFAAFLGGFLVGWVVVAHLIEIAPK